MVRTVIRFILLRILCLGLIFAAMTAILSALTDDGMSESGADIGLTLAMFLGATLLAVSLGVLDGIREARKRRSIAVGLACWAGAICIVAFLGPIIDKSIYFLNEPNADNHFGGFVAAILVDALIVTPLISTFVCLFVLGAFAISYTITKRPAPQQRNGPI